VTANAVQPAGQPPRFMALGWRILNALAQDRGGISGKFVRGGCARFGAVHLFEHLKQSPAFAAVTFGLEHAFAFEIYVIDQGIAAVRRPGDARELALDVVTLARAGLLKHLSERLLQPGDEKLRLKIDSVGEELP